MPGRDHPSRVFCAGLRAACVRQARGMQAIKFVKGQSGNCWSAEGSFNDAGLLGRQAAHPCAILLLFPCSALLFWAISRLRIDFVADLRSVPVFSCY
jgi:hypothetical protein